VAENIQDSLDRKRKPLGSQLSFSKLIEAKVQDIRFRVQNGERQDYLAKEYGVSKATIWNKLNKITDIHKRKYVIYWIPMAERGIGWSLTRDRIGEPNYFSYFQLINGGWKKIS
jgi:hypothetical protein